MSLQSRSDFDHSWALERSAHYQHLNHGYLASSSVFPMLWPATCRSSSDLAVCRASPLLPQDLVVPLGWEWSGSSEIDESDLEHLRIYIINTSSTAQGGGGSFKNRKPIGEIGCCESGMAERIHWWTERWLELCLLEWLQWLQWSPHPQLLDVVWCTATVVVVVA